MLSYIFRLIRDFEKEHGIHPNLLYLNDYHVKHLIDGLAEDFSLQHITELLQLELIINREVLHPHVVWTQTAHRIAG
ncbi:hypothetical protein [Kaarinaea lacus]